MIKRSKSDSSKLDQKYLRVMIRLSSGIMLFTIILSRIFYPDEYSFWNHYISYLGGIKTVFGHPNPISRYIFTTGIWFISGIFLLMLIEYFSVKNRSKLNILKGIILFIMFMSSILIGIPYDLDNYRVIHSTGAAIYYFTFSLYLFFCHFTELSKKKIQIVYEKPSELASDKIHVLIMFLVTLCYFIAFFLGYKKFLPMIQKTIILSSIFCVIFIDLEDL